MQLQAPFSLPLLTCSLLYFTWFPIFQSTAQSLACLSLFLLSILLVSGLFLSSLVSHCALYLCARKYGHSYLQRGGLLQ